MPGSQSRHLFVYDCSNEDGVVSHEEWKSETAAISVVFKKVGEVWKGASLEAVYKVDLSMHPRARACLSDEPSSAEEIE